MMKLKMKNLVSKLVYQLKREEGISTYVAFVLVLVVLLPVIVYGGYMANSSRIVNTIDHALEIVGQNMTQNGALTAKGQEQLIAYIEKSGLNPNKIYLNATTAPQSFGSRGLEATIGYDWDLRAPGFDTTIWHKYYERGLPLAQSQLIPGSGADVSGSVPIDSIFGGIQGGTNSGGSSSGSGTSIQATSMTMTCSNSSPVANSSVIISGTAYVGANTAPAGTQIALNGGGVRQVVSTDSTGKYTANVAFTSQGTITLLGTSGTASASITVNVQPSVPASITLQVPSTIQIGNTVNITGKVVDAAGKIVADNTVVTISSSNAADIPPTNVYTSYGSFTYFVDKITSLNSFTITATAGSATVSKTVNVIPGRPESITLNISPGNVAAGSIVTFSGKVFGPYGTPPAANTLVKVVSGTNVVDTMPSAVTDEHGNFSMIATLTKAGTHVFYAQSGSINSPTATAVVTSSVPYKVNNLSQTPNPLNAGANLSVSGYVSDRYDNPVSSGTSLSIVSSALSENLTTAVQSGTFSTHATLQTPGIQILTVADSAGNPLAGGSLTVTVLGTSAFTLTPEQDQYNVKAGQSIGTVRFVLKDSNGQPVAGKTVKFTETPQGDSLITPLTAVTDAAGRVQTTVGTLTKAGTHTLMAALEDDSAVIGTVGITVTPGAPAIILSTVAPSTTQVWTAANPVPLPTVSGTLTDSYANPLNGAILTVSGGFGTSVSGKTEINGFFSVSIKPTVVGGPYTLNFQISSDYGNYSTSKGTLTVSATPVVPVQSVLEGVTIMGQTGTMPNMATRNPNGIGVGRSQSLTYWTGGGSSVYFKPQKGYYDGNDTWTYINAPNLIPENIKKDVEILGVIGALQSTPTHGSRSWTAPGTYTWTVPEGVNSVLVGIYGAGGHGSYHPGGYIPGIGNRSATGGGGGGGAFGLAFVTLTPGQHISITVGGVGTSTKNSSFGDLIVNGGQGFNPYAPIQELTAAKGGEAPTGAGFIAGSKGGDSYWGSGTNFDGAGGGGPAGPGQTSGAGGPTFPGSIFPAGGYGGVGTGVAGSPGGGGGSRGTPGDGAVYIFW